MVQWGKRRGKAAKKHRSREWELQRLAKRYLSRRWCCVDIEGKIFLMVDRDLLARARTCTITVKVGRKRVGVDASIVFCTIRLRFSAAETSSTRLPFCSESEK